jgi:hypothetical protein
MLVSEQILKFYKSLKTPSGLPSTVETMNPYQSEEGWQLTQSFYQKYYADEDQRHILFGINPGRFGGGITGIPFTDPLLLDTKCGITNSFDKRAELSSRFIYEIIEAYGSINSFYKRFFITGMSPLGYVENGKNLNYYDLPDWKSIFEKDVVKWIKQQLKFSIKTDKAFSIGQGKNLKFLQDINKKHGFFDEVIPLPHPRWVMQYRLKRKQEFIDEYLCKLI